MIKTNTTRISVLAALLSTSFCLASSCFAFTFDRDVPSNIQTQINQDLEFIKTIHSDTQSTLHTQVFGTVSGDSYSQFFNSRITAVGMNGCGDASAVACVIPYRDSSKMWLTKNYIQFNHPQIARLMILFHESRHTEQQNYNWPHEICPDPFLDADHHPVDSIWTGAPLANKAACDSTPFGSYGSSMIMLKNISKFCTNCTDKVKMDAGIYADDQLKRITDKKSHQKILDDLYQSS